jgi:LacI family transcriptional regulator
MKKRNLNIYDIAKEAGVSIATVSRAINNSDKVKPETMEKIQSIIEQSNYTPNAIAQSLVLKSTRTIGVIIGSISNPFYGELVRAIEDRASDVGYTILLGNTDNKFNEEEKYIDIFLKKKVDGIIFAGGRKMEERYDRHIHRVAKSIPVVLANHILFGENVYCVLSDEAKGAALAMEYLIQKDHRSIAYINGYSTSYASIIKKENYVKALLQNNIDIKDQLIVNAVNDEMSGGFAACEELIQRNASFSAVFAANDLMAMGAIKSLINHGFRVPEDIVVVGYDDIDMCNYFSPGLTSISQNIKLLGERAVEIMKDVLEGKEISKISYFEPFLIKRGSSEIGL